MLILQSTLYFNSYLKMNRRLKGVEGVIGMEAMNEPHPVNFMNPTPL